MWMLYLIQIYSKAQNTIFSLKSVDSVFYIIDVIDICYIVDI